jgi:hypothetical protein
MPVLTAAFVAGMAWSLTGTGGRDGPLDLLAGVLFLATPLAVFVAIATRLTRGRAWSPAVTLVMAAASLLLGSLTAATLIDLLG